MTRGDTLQFGDFEPTRPASPADAAGGAADLLQLLDQMSRHSGDAICTVELDGSVAPLLIRPVPRIFESDLDLLSLDVPQFARLRLRDRRAAAAFSPGQDRFRGRLWALTWNVAMHGDCASLLPTIAGPVCYRVAAGFDASALLLSPDALALLERLRTQASTLQELQDATASPQLAARLLNALHLQSALLAAAQPQRAARNLGNLLRRWS